MQRASLLARCVLLAQCALIAACTSGNQSADMWTDYLSRLERVLETDIEPSFMKVSQYPSRKKLRQSSENLRIDIFDFLSILECDLSRVIAARNSVLGKVMSASQQWLYEVALIKALESCIEILNRQEIPPEVLPELQRVLLIKRSELAGIVWNATLAGPELQQLMSARKGALATDFQFSYYANLTTALAQLSQWTDNPMYPGNSAEYELINQQLLTYPVYGQLMFSLQEATEMLESVSTTLRRKLADRPL